YCRTSNAHSLFAEVLTTSGFPTRTQCFRFFLRIINPAARYTRCTRLWFTCSPERPNNTCSRRYPKRGFSRANSTSRVRSGSSERPALVAIARYCHRHQTARTPLAEGIISAHLLDSRLQGYELQ